VARSSVYEYVGGDRAFLALAAAHHRRCLADPELAHPFEHHIRHDHVERLAAYWAEVFGGPLRYTRDFGGHSAMLGVHAGEGIGEEFSARFARCFLEAADDAGFPPDEDLRELLRRYIEQATAEVEGYSPPGSSVPSDLPVPRWSWSGKTA
jgi:hemoglobin